MRRPMVSTMAACAVSMAACITVNIYFPAPEVRAAAEEIVEETWGNNDPARSSQLDNRLPARFAAWLADTVSPASAHAAEADINVSTAAIRALKESMKARSGTLKPHLGAGKLGLGKDGMLAVRDLSGLGLREQAEIRRLVDAENRDRRSLYKEIAKANNFEEERVDDIQAIFAETWREKAENGWWTQDSNGTWRQTH